MASLEALIKVKETQERIEKYLAEYPELRYINPASLYLSKEDAKIYFGYKELKALLEHYREKAGNRI